MKTILYQPLFINPQAYFVFPQLYHIEKGDSYIEPANITGQLIINDLRSFIGCHGDIILFNRSLTEYEISWVKNNMMCSKPQEPDIDL